MTIITGSALVYWQAAFGVPARNLTPDLHSIVDGRIVTWAEVIEARRKRQRERLARILTFDKWRLYRVWVAYFDQSLMGGLECFYRPQQHRLWNVDLPRAQGMDDPASDEDFSARPAARQRRESV